jgi:uncharacterized protein YjdB
MPLWARAVIALLVLGLTSPGANAQTDSSGIHHIIFSPGGILDKVVDRSGHQYDLQAIAINDTLRGDSSTASIVTSCTAGYFQLFLEPGCGMENSSDPVHMARRNVLCRMLGDMSQFVRSPLSVTNGKVNIWIRKKSNVPGASGTGYATSFFNVAASSTIGGIADNTAWLTINSGKDAYEGVAPTHWFPIANRTFFHVIATFDFDSYSWHTDMSTAPGSSEYDLYTVALRELTHALGMASEIAGDGTSLLGSNYNYYSRYDRFLKTHSGIPLLMHLGSNNMTGYKFNSSSLIAANVLSPYAGACTTDSSTCDTAVQFAGSTIVPVYTPNCYEAGASLSSFEDMCVSGYTNNQYFTASNITEAGSMKRYLKPEERLALGDIGYKIDTIFGDTSVLNRYVYSGGMTEGASTVGVADLYNEEGTFRYFTSRLTGTVAVNGSGVSTGMTEMMGNDVNADGFEGLQAINGSGSFSVTSGTSTSLVEYTPDPSEQGEIIFSYIPVNNITGHRGNITYAALLVTHASGCPAQACNLVENGNFNAGTVSGHCGEFGPEVTTSPVCNWRRYSNTPDYYVAGCTAPSYGYTMHFTSPTYSSETGGYSIGDPTTPGGSFVGLLSDAGYSSGYNAGSHEGSEGIQTQLSAPLYVGGRYTLEFDARVAVDLAHLGSYYWWYHDVVLQFYTKTGSTSAFPPAPTAEPTSKLIAALPDGIVVPAQAIPTPGNAWQHFSIPFTYNSAASGTLAQPQWLMILNAHHLTAAHNGIGNNFRDYVFLDNVKITPMMEAPPMAVCTGGSVVLSGSHLVMAFNPSPTQTNTWTASPDLSCLACNHPTATPSSAFNTYYVTDNIYQCTLPETVTVVSTVDAGTISGPTSVCVDQTINLTETTTAGVWSSSDNTIAWVSSGGVVHGVSAGTVTITFSVSACGSDYTTYTITVNPLPTPAAITGVTELCVGTTGVLTASEPDGTWESTNDVLATIDPTSGLVSALTGGVVTFNYIVSNSCGNATTPHTVVISTMPSVTITGPSTVCAGSGYISLLHTGGGILNISDPSLIGISFSTGGLFVYGISPGTTTISYTSTNICGTATASHDVTVLPAAIAVITPSATSFCTGSSVILTATTGTGYTYQWYRGGIAISGAIASTYIATIPGVYTVRVNNIDNCPATSTPVTITEITTPNPGVISGTSSICVTSSTHLTETVTGGNWHSDNEPVAQVDASGNVTGLSVGTAVISYTVTNSCGSATTTFTITVLNVPTAGTISGASIVCLPGTTVLTETVPSGTWSSSNPLVAEIGSTSGIVTGVSNGEVIMTYTVSNICGSAYTTYPLTIGTPDPGEISGTETALCIGQTTILENYITDGSWSSSNTSIAIVDGSGLVTAIMDGTATITYSVSNACGTVYTTYDITVNPTPVIFPYGSYTFCVGSGMSLYVSPTGGTWVSDASSIADVDGSGTVTTGPSTGTAHITYTSLDGCPATVPVVVNPLPATPVISVSGTIPFCAGGFAILYTTSIGTVQWYKDGVAIATGPSYHATTAGAYTCIVTDPVTNCSSAVSAPVNVIVNPVPTTLVSPVYVCPDNYADLSTAVTPAGGTWSESSTRFDISAPYVHGISTGAGIATYTLPGGCSTYVQVVVYPVPHPVIVHLGTEPLEFCEGGSVNLHVTGGGITNEWFNSSSLVGTGFTYLATTADYYYVTSTNTYGCSATSAPVTVTVYPNPVVDAGPDITVCDPKTEAQLNTTVNSVLNPATGYTCSWTPPTGLSSDIIPNPTATPGTTTNYVVTVTDANGCVGSDDVNVFVSPVIKDGCDPCRIFNGESYTMLSGTLNTDLPAGNYYVTSDVDIDGHLTFTGCVMLMAPGVNMFVLPTSTLELKACHLFTCDENMWTGITLQSDNIQTGTIKLTSTGRNIPTLIEDAKEAISVDKPIRPTSPSVYYIESRAAIFNKNVDGIVIRDYTPTASSISTDPTRYEFLVENTVFTSRELSPYVFSSVPYPFAWPSTYSTYGLKQPWNPTATDPVNGPYMAPYNSFNPDGCPTWSGTMPYYQAWCKNGMDAHAGIVLEQVGSPVNYNVGMTLGSDPTNTSNTQLNLFDGLNFGILATNANLRVYNSSFMNLRYIYPGTTAPGISGGTGICASANNGVRYYLQVLPSTAFISGKPTGARNSFYNCNYGVYAGQYYRVTGLSAYMTSMQVIKNPMYNYGYYVETNNTYEDFKITSNTIYNLTTGILVRYTHSPRTSPAPGHTEITQNRIFGKVPGDTYGIHFTDRSIWVENATPYMPPVYTVNQINVDNNYMKDVYNGIAIRGIATQYATSIYDTVYGLTYNPYYIPLSTEKQYGIHHLKCIRSKANLNTVTGDSYDSKNWYAYWIEGCNFPTVKCNYAGLTGRGFQFTNTFASGNMWFNNTMEKCGKGFVLNASTLGTQGTTTMSCGAIWLPAYPSFWNSTYPQTYVEGGALASNSKLYVKAPAIPVANTALPSNARYSTTPVGTYPTSLLSTSFISELCSSSTSSGGGSTGRYIEAMSDIAAGNNLYTDYHKQHAWNSQFDLYQEMLANDSLTTATDTLAAFDSMAANSRYAILTTIEGYISSGDGASAQALLDSTDVHTGANPDSDTLTGASMADKVDPTTDIIVQNYRDYYQICISAMADTLDSVSTDRLIGLANDCPITGGAVVYKAQNLYNSLFYHEYIYDGYCIDDTSATDTTGEKMGAHQNSVTVFDGQHYELMPNPNNGQFTLMQQTADDGPVSVEIVDMAGRIVFRESVQFTGKEGRISVSNTPPGVYVLKLVDGKGRIFTFRYITQ